MKTTVKAALGALAAVWVGGAAAQGLLSEADLKARENIIRKVSETAAETARLQAQLKDAVEITAYRGLVKNVNGTNVWTAALQKAVDEHEIVKLPAAAGPYWMDATVVLRSNRRIEAEQDAVVKLMPPMDTILFRNEHAENGTRAPAPRKDTDVNIAITGGRWEDWCPSRMGYGRTGKYDAKRSFYGVSAMVYFSNVKHVTLKDMTFHRTGGFSFQCGDAENLTFRNIFFDRCFADGLHINGGTKYVSIYDVRGEVGDDLVALNAYDWLNSSANWGVMEYVVCDKLDQYPSSRYKAMRIQPGVYWYEDGTSVDCAIRNLLVRDVKGIDTFKMYLQTPAYRVGTKPERGGVGSGGNIFLEDIELNMNRPVDKFAQYMNGDELRGHWGAFEIGSNLESLYLRNIRATFHTDKFPKQHLVMVGPKSIILDRKNGAVEVFDPYVKCKVGKLVVENLQTVAGTAPKQLVRCTKFDDINKDGISTGSGEIAELVGAER